MDRASDPRALSAERQTTTRGAASSVRLAGHRPDHEGEPRRFRARPVALGARRKDAGAGPAEARTLLDSIDVSTPVGLRDRALIALMVYSFARVGAALAMKVEDLYTQNRRLWVRLKEKGGKAHTMPCHHNLEEYLIAYVDGAGLRAEPKAPLFPTIARSPKSRRGQLTRAPMHQANAHDMVRKRAAAAGIATLLGNHSFRATGITAYLKNGGTLEKAAAMANHTSTRTTQLYDRRHDEMSLDEVERIGI
jgi:integrase